MDRKRIMEEAIHSGEMEGAYVSTEFRHDAEQYVEGNFTIEELWQGRSVVGEHARIEAETTHA